MWILPYTVYGHGFHIGQQRITLNISNRAQIKLVKIDLAVFIFFFFNWVLRPFQEYITYIEPIVHQRWAKT